MYYEEKLINGVMMYRGTPDGTFEPLDHAELSRRLVDKDAEIKELRRGLNLYIHAGCGNGTHFANQKSALDNALILLNY